MIINDYTKPLKEPCEVCLHFLADNPTGGTGRCQAKKGQRILGMDAGCADLKRPAGRLLEKLTRREG